MSREIRLNAFDMNCVGHQSPGLWAHPRDRSWQYKDLEYWTDLARILERGKFDGLFIADVLGIYDVYNGNGDAAIRQATQVPVNDPLSLIAPMALVTEHLGFGLTASLSFEHPYPFARRLSTLDHLTKGRIGWNIVTSYLESGAKNLGQKAQTEHDARYDYAEEYLEVCYKLWEGSWEEGAVLRDRERRIFSDPSKIHEIRHVGKHFQVPGIHLRHNEGNISHHAEGARVRDHRASSRSKLRFQLTGNIRVQCGKDNLRQLALTQLRHVRLYRHRSDLRRQRSVELPLAGLAVRLTGAAIARREPSNLKPGVIVQKLNESLTDHAGRAKNAYPSPFHRLRITRPVRLSHETRHKVIRQG